jgi:hypothetical protein
MNKNLSPQPRSSLQASAAAQQVRTADGPETIAQQVLGSPICGGYAGVADRDIGLPSIQIENAISADDLKRRSGTYLCPTRKAWHQPPARKGIRCGYPERSIVAVLSDGSHSGSKRFETFANGREQIGSGLSQGNWPRLSAKKFAATVAFEQSDLMTDRRRGHPKFIRSLFEAQMPRGGFKRAKFDERWKLSHTPSVDEIYSSAPEIFKIALDGEAGRKFGNTRE